MNAMSRCFVFLLLTVSGLTLWAAEQKPHYEMGRKTFDGIGKYYFGREIAHYMTHHAAPWLERAEREKEERPDLLHKALALKPGEVIADIGCGTGYHSWRMAQAVGPKGVVYGVEIQKEMLEHLAVQMRQRGATNVVGILGTTKDPKLPAAVDLALLVDVYHEFDFPHEMMQALCAKLKPGGRVVFVEFRAEDPKVPIKALHKLSQAQLRKEMSAQPLVHVETLDVRPWQHIVVFRKRAAP